jgi:signal transduction histidine kinase
VRVIRGRRLSPTVVLTGAVLVLLPLLAVLQYHWISGVGEESGSRMRAVAAGAAMALSADLAFEAGRAWRERVAFAADPAERTDGASLVVDALVVDRLDGRPAQSRVRRWSPDARTCEPAEWPDRYGEIRAEGHHLFPLLQRRSTALGILPVDVPAAGGPPTPARLPCDVSGGGIFVFRLDTAVLRQSLLPEVARRHLDALQRDFQFAIVTGPALRDVVYEAEGADAAAIAARPDLVVPVTLADISRSGRAGRGGRGGDARDGSMIAAAVADGHAPGDWNPRADGGDGWFLVAQHRAGSLESAVMLLRIRNLAISVGILILMGVAVALIGVNARRAERLGRQQVEFVAAVSHEMRTPVTAIDLAARNLEDGVVEDPARVRRYGGVIRAEVRRLAETVERVLQFAALEAGRGGGPPVEVDLGAIVEDVVATARVERPGAEIDLEIDPGGRRVLGDGTALRSSVRNLVENALKYGGSPAWARVRVTCDDGPPREVRVTVDDRGPGIAAPDVPHVFEPFYRGRLALERRVAGSGLGLHIVKRSIEAAGGRVSLRTGRGSGTAITLHLPLPPAAPADDGDATTSAARRG